MSKNNSELNRLRAELEKKDSELRTLNSELTKAGERERDLEETRTAMLYMLEDLNESTANVEKAKKEWEETFDAVEDMISIHDKDYNIIRINKAVSRKFGKPPREIIGMKCYNLFHAEEYPVKLCPHKKTTEEGVSATCEIKDPYMGGVFSVSTYPIFNKDGKYYASVHIAKDITEIKETELKIKQEMEISTRLLMLAETTAHTADIDRLMEQVVYCCHKILNCDICISYLWDRDMKVFLPSQAYGLANEQIPFFNTESLYEKVEWVDNILNRNGAVVERFVVKSSELGEKAAAPNLQVLQWIKDIHTLTNIPLTGRKGPLGLIICIYTKPIELIEREERVINGISHQVSTALEEARLYKESIDNAIELSHKIATIEVMHEIDRSILSTLEPNEILETAAMMIAKIIPCDGITVFLVDKEKEGFTYAAGYGLTFLPKGSFVPFGDTSATEITRTRNPQYIANLKEVGEPLLLEKRLTEEGSLSHIRVPLTIQKEIIGILNVSAKRPSAYTTDDLSTLEKVAGQIGVALENSRLLEDLKELLLGTIESLASAIDAKSHWTKGHSERVTGYALMIGKEREFDDETLRNLRLAGLLHDVGKIGTLESLLDKPDRLTEEEFEIVKEHADRGAEILSPIKQLKDIIPVIRYHHEHYDGKGYPEGLKGDEIPLSARILCVADAYDSMTSDRPYRKAPGKKKASEELKRCSGTQFDPNVAASFLKILEKGAVTA